MRVNSFFNIILTFTFLFTAVNTVNSQAQKRFKVVLDAGHGGSDPGKVAKNNLKEKDIALRFVLGVGKELSKYPDIEVVYTRTTDTFIDLHERGHIANKAAADLFISVHCNAHHSQAYGSETYVLGLHRNATNLAVAKAENEVIFLEDNFEETYAQYDLSAPESAIGLELMQEVYLDQSIQLASFIQDNFRNKLKRKDRSVKQAGFIVLHQTVMPSVLVETGFITNTSEGKYLNSKKGTKEISKALADAILKYKRLIDAGQDVDFELPQEAIDKPADDKIVPNVTFKIQIAASKRKLALKPYNFKGLKELSRSKNGKYYKYYYGSTSNYSLIQRQLAEVKAKGFTSAYIVSFDKNNIKVPVKTVLN